MLVQALLHCFDGSLWTFPPALSCPARPCGGRLCPYDAPFHPSINPYLDYPLFIPQLILTLIILLILILTPSCIELCSRSPLPSWVLVLTQVRGYLERGQELSTLLPRQVTCLRDKYLILFYLASRSHPGGRAAPRGRGQP